MVYVIDYAPDTERHFRCLSAREQAIVLDAVPQQLRYQPRAETRNRKRLRPNPFAPWELRIGALRVYYDVEDAPVPIVKIRAVGIKHRNRVLIGGEEVVV